MIETLTSSEAVLLMYGCIILIVFIVLRVIIAFVDRPKRDSSQKDSSQRDSSQKDSELVGELRNENRNNETLIGELKEAGTYLRDLLEQEKEKNRKILSQKKSSETRLGQISEQLAPFLKDCPYDPKQMHFVGQPIDFLIYDYDNAEIIFLEVKSGNAKESSRQRTIKNIIKEGRVFYEKMRINDKGVKITRETNNEGLKHG